MQLPCNDESELPNPVCVTPIVYEENLESHEVSAEFRDISKKHNFHKVFGWGCHSPWQPLQLLWEDGSKLPDILGVIPIVYKEHPESHKVSFRVIDGLSFSPVFVYEEELDKEALSI